MQEYFRTLRSNPELAAEIGRHGDQNEARKNRGSRSRWAQRLQAPRFRPLLKRSPRRPLISPIRLKHKNQMFYNVKGGTGKSTLTAQYVMRAAMNGLRVLALDSDGQGHLTVNLDILDAHERATDL